MALVSTHTFMQCCVNLKDRNEINQEMLKLVDFIFFVKEFFYYELFLNRGLENLIDDSALLFAKIAA
jgi:hypothetical protein